MPQSKLLQFDRKRHDLHPSIQVIRATAHCAVMYDELNGLTEFYTEQVTCACRRL